MRSIFIHIFLFLTFSLAAQVTENPADLKKLEQAVVLADSAEFLIYEDRDLNLAQRLNQQAAVIFLQLNNFEGQAHCQINNAIIWAQKGSFSRCLELIDALAEDIPGRISDTSALAGLIYAAQAWCLWGMAEYESSYEAALEACHILRREKDWERFVDVSLIASYSIYYSIESKFSDIDQHIEETYQTAMRYLPQNRLVFKFIYQLYGSILYQQGRIDQAIHITEEGLKHQYKLLIDDHINKDSSAVAKYYSNLGRMFSEKNDVEQAISYYKNAFSLYEQLGDYAELIKLAARIGDLFIMKGKDVESDNYYAKIPLYIPHLPKSPVLQKRNNTFEHISVALYYNHFLFNDSILDYYNEHLHYIQQHDLAVDKAYVNIGKAYEDQGNFAQAEKYYKKALEVEEKKFGHKGTKIASLYYDLGHLAAESGNNSLAISYMDSVINMLNTSPATHEDKMQLLEYLLDKSIAMEAFHRRGDAQMREGQLKKAHTDFKNVILLANYLRDNYTDSDSKLISINKLRPVYEKAAAMAWKLHEKEKDAFYKNLVFDYAEHSKSTLLNENILKFRNNFAANSSTGIPKELLQAEEKFIAQIDHCKEHIIESRQEHNKSNEAFYFDKLLHLEQSLDSLEKSLQAKYPSYRTWDHGRDSIVSPQVVQKHLANNELFIEYFISDHHLFIIYISNKEIKIRELPNYNPRTYKSKARNLRRTLSNIDFILEFEKESYNTFCEEAHWFYKQLLEDDMLKGKNHLIIVPDRNLHYIPFEVLLTKAPKNKTDIDYHDLAYLIRTYSIHYEYSAAIMVNSEKRPNTSNGRILGFAATYGQKFDYDQLPKSVQRERTHEEVRLHSTAFRIPGTLEELEELSHHFHGDYFFGEKATERNFKEILHQNEYSVIHLAMHGVVDYEDPAYSSLMFTEDLDSLEDNLLYSYETQHLNGEHANLVVLSACKTGYGKYAQGEGIISLGRSFMYAGIPSIVMTLWELNDQTSVEVMDLFYDNLVLGQSKNVAMQNAKLSYLKNNTGFTAHPFFWASFVSIGNQLPISLEHKPYAWYWWALGLVALAGLGYWWKQKKKARA